MQCSHVQGIKVSLSHPFNMEASQPADSFLNCFELPKHRTLEFQILYENRVPNRDGVQTGNELICATWESNRKKKFYSQNILELKSAKSYH